MRDLAGRTFAVKTSQSDMLDGWREILTDARAGFVEQGEDWANEVALADALLAILNDQPPVIASDNPYAEVVAQVITDIANYKPSEE